MSERIRIGGRLDRDHSRERHLLPRRRRHIVSAQRLGRQPATAWHLRNHLIRPALEVEAVDVIAAEQRCERVAEVRHGDTEVARL